MVLLGILGTAVPIHLGSGKDGKFKDKKVKLYIACKGYASYYFLAENKYSKVEE